MRDNRRRTLVVIGAVALAWLGSGLPSHSAVATIAVAVPALGVTVLALRWRSDLQRASARIRLAITCWTLLLVVAALWELWVFTRQPAWNVPNPAYPTLTVLVEPALEQRIVRFLAWLVWLCAGARLTRPAPGGGPSRATPA